MASNKRPKASQNASTSYQTQTHCLSAQTVAENDDLLLQILICLPITSLLTFKSVSKHWLSLISHPQFCHRRRTLLCSGLFLLQPLPDDPKPVYNFVSLKQCSNPLRPCIPNKPFSLSFATDPFGITILQSCNGLWLCTSSCGSQRRKDYYVYNPTTHHYTTLPKPPFRSGGPNRRLLGLTLAFDPSKSNHYKVVCVRFGDFEHTQLEIEIYSSESGPWRLCSGRTHSVPVPTYNLEFNRGVYWNGCVHWITSWGSAAALRFELESERLSAMPLPPISEGWEDWNEMGFGYFGSSGDHLHLIGIYDPPSTQLDVYEMERDYSGWFVKFRVDVTPVLAAFSDADRVSTLSAAQDLDLSKFMFSVMCVVRCEVDEESYMVLHFPSGLVKHCLKTGSFVKTCDIDAGYGDVDRLLYKDYAYPFIESLACV